MVRAAMASAALLVAAVLFGGTQGLRPPAPDRPLTAKDNDTVVTVGNGTFQLWLPRRGGTQFQWEPTNSGPSILQENRKARAFKSLTDFLQLVDSTGAEAKGGSPPRVGGFEFQASTFVLPPASEGKGPFELELAYCPGKPSEQKGPLYKPASLNLEERENQPKPNMRFRIRVLRK